MTSKLPSHLKIDLKNRQLSYLLYTTWSRAINKFHWLNSLIKGLGVNARSIGCGIKLNKNNKVRLSMVELVVKVLNKIILNMASKNNYVTELIRLPVSASNSFNGKLLKLFLLVP